MSKKTSPINAQTSLMEIMREAFEAAGVNVDNLDDSTIEDFAEEYAEKAVTALAEEIIQKEVAECGRCADVVLSDRTHGGYLPCSCEISQSKGGAA